MGILDEAIREHLDLKRRRGAEDSEVKRLEDEAFGPPTRPGEPDFPESQEQPAIENGAGAPGSDEPLAGEAGEGPEAATTLLQPERQSEPEGEAPEAPAEPDLTAIEHPAVETEGAGGAERPAPDEPAAEPEAPETAEEQPAGLFDQEAGKLEFDDLDLDLGDEDEDLVTDSGLVEGEEGEREPQEPEPEAPPPASEEHPAAHLETVEHPMEEELGGEPPSEEEEALAEPPSEEHPVTEEEPVPESEEHTDEDEEEGEGTGEGDVLEETPEFLRDQPEDDELWFEQGEPKDFDF